MASVNLVEAAKKAACLQAVADHFDPSFKYVGIGSGSTIAYVVEAIAAMGPEVTSSIQFIPTGSISAGLLETAGLNDISVNKLMTKTGIEANAPDLVPGNNPTRARQRIDVYFDGADEVDDELNCIKGGGACLFQEKLVASRSRKFICVADSRKRAPVLLSKWAYIPIEVSPAAAESVRDELLSLGARHPVIRVQGTPLNKLPVKTDNNNYIVDAPFPPLLLNSQYDKMDPAKGIWTPDTLLEKINNIVGVLEVGIFAGMNGPEAASAGTGTLGVKPVKVYFGKPDGGVETLG
ncbi:ribose 5-phosphate isomerase A [Xylariomycetidae sp. FL0641]|nr:ribose 5-phosphate isomerase A [Xylariomycetidae sp. FL0641]